MGTRPGNFLWFYSTVTLSPAPGAHGLDLTGDQSWDRAEASAEQGYSTRRADYYDGRTGIDIGPLPHWFYSTTEYSINSIPPWPLATAWPHTICRRFSTHRQLLSGADYPDAGGR